MEVISAIALILVVCGVVRYTGGFGIDILTLYDLNLRLEYSFNQLNENGLFLHTKGGF